MAGGEIHAALEAPAQHLLYPAGKRGDHLVGQALLGGMLQSAAGSVSSSIWPKPILSAADMSKRM